MTEDKSDHLSPQETALQALILDPDLERLEDLLAEFNLFRVLDITRDELSHSAFLSWLLNPRQTHGLGDYFLRHFLKAAAGRARDLGIGELTPIDVDGWVLDDVRVVAERQVGTGRGRIDILLVSERDEFVCIIENKIGTGEHSDQLAKYLEGVGEDHSNLAPFPIFLTPDGIAPVTEADAERYVPIGYQVVADLIERTLTARGSSLNANVVSFLEQYIRTLGRYVVSAADNIDQLAYRILENHRAAFNIIEKVRWAPGTLALETIDRWVSQYADDLSPTVHSPKIRRFSSSQLGDIPEFRRANAWRGTDHLILFEFLHDVKRRYLRLDLVVGPGDQWTRARVFACAKKTGRPFRNFKSSTKYAHIAARYMLTPRNYHPFEHGQTEEACKKAIESWYKSDYPVLVNAIRAEFELEPVTGP